MRKFSLILLVFMFFASAAFADGIQIDSRGAKKGANDDITSMTGLDNDGIPLAKIANAASDGANSDITSLGALSGQQSIPTVNLTGGQIAFPASQAASAGSNVLDDYEEGSWTPILTTTGTDFESVTYSAERGGKYRKIGDLVIFWGAMVTDSVTVGSANGDVAIGGLPFTTASNSTGWDGRPSVTVTYARVWTGEVPSGGRVGDNTTYFVLYYRANVDGDTSPTAVADVKLDANSNYATFFGIYQAQ